MGTPENNYVSPLETTPADTASYLVDMLNLPILSKNKSRHQACQPKHALRPQYSSWKPMKRKNKEEEAEHEEQKALENQTVIIKASLNRCGAALKLLHKPCWFAIGFKRCAATIISESSHAGRKRYFIFSDWSSTSQKISTKSFIQKLSPFFRKKMDLKFKSFEKWMHFGVITPTSSFCEKPRQKTQKLKLSIKL